jgi:hypothetical protein
MGLEIHPTARFTSAEATVAKIKIPAIALIPSDTAVTIADGTYGIPITSDMNGMNLTEALAIVYDKGITGTTDIQIRRKRGAVEVDMLSTPITIGDEYSASDGVIDTANDDLQTGDLLFVDRDDVHSGTAPNGLSLGFSAELP